MEHYGEQGTGQLNCITGSSSYSAVHNGWGNRVIGAGFGTILSGRGNLIQPGIVTDRQLLIASGAYNQILGGYNSIIASGGGNIVNSTQGGIFSGLYNTLTGAFSSISGGTFNTVTNDSSFIGGGRYNTVASRCSSIPGGQNNYIAAAFPFSAVFGASVNAVASYTFHVQCLNACNTPSIPTVAFPIVTIVKWDSTLGPVPAGFMPLYIKI